MSSYNSVHDAKSRASAMASLRNPMSELYSDLITDFEISGSEVDYAKNKLRHTSDNHGPAILYASSMAIWNTLSQELEHIDFARYFDSKQQNIITAYSFNRDPARMANAFLQSAITAPTIFTCWWGEATGAADYIQESRRQWGNRMSIEAIQATLSANWFSDAMRQGSVTSTGLYRNSTGLHLSFETFITRSAIRPMQSLKRATHATALPLEAYETPDGMQQGRLSDDFIKFLRERLQRHNASVRSDNFVNDLHAGTSKGCPIANDDAMYKLTCNVLKTAATEIHREL